MSQKIYKERVGISHVLEKNLLEQFDKLAKKHKLTRRELINIAMQKLLDEGVV